MPRVSTGPATHRRRKKWLKLAKGYQGGRSRLYRTARNAAERALAYSYRDRRQRKRQFRRLWIVRINAAARQHGLTYGALIHGLKTAGVGLDRKALAGLAHQDPDAFQAVVKVAKAATN